MTDSSQKVEPQQLIGSITNELERLRTITDTNAAEFNKLMAEYQRRGAKINKELLAKYMEHYWIIKQTKNPNEVEVYIPIWSPTSVGWYDRTEGGHNVFVVNNFTRHLGGTIPQFIMDELELPEAWNIKVEGNKVTFDENIRDKVGKALRKHLSLIEKDRATIKHGHEVDVIADIIGKGSLPFTPIPVRKEDLMESDFTRIFNDKDEKYYPLEIFEGKYSFQGQAYKMFLKHGAVGIWWGMGFGKTVIGTYAFSTVKGRKMLVVPTRTLVDQWKEFFEKNCPRLLQEVEIYTYAGLAGNQYLEVSKNEYTLSVFDEAHTLPAETFSKVATLRTKYRMGLSATPIREDKKTNWIMALTGYPLGLDWPSIMGVIGIVFHTINVHVVKDIESKYALLQQLYNPNKKTIIFVNELAEGERIAKMYDIPFISGQTKNRIQIIRENVTFVASRVLELGIDIKNLQVIIEMFFLFGSRREQIQRTGRLMHSEMEVKVHHIIFTIEEIERYGKRLFGLHERGFMYKLIPHMTGIKIIHPRDLQPETESRPRKGIRIYSLKVKLPKEMTDKYPGLEKKFQRFTPMEQHVFLAILKAEKPVDLKQIAIATPYTAGYLERYSKPVKGEVQLDFNKGINQGIIRKVEGGKYEGIIE